MFERREFAAFSSSRYHSICALYRYGSLISLRDTYACMVLPLSSFSLDRTFSSQRRPLVSLLFHTERQLRVNRFSSRSSNHPQRHATLSDGYLAWLRLGEFLTPLSRCNGHRDRSTRCSCPSTLLALVVALDHFAYKRLAWCLVRWSFDAVKCVGRRDEDGIVDDDLGVCPSGWQAKRVSARPC